MLFPAFIRQRGGPPKRIWVAGCSSGLGAYSLALSFLEFAEQSGRPWQFQFFATDWDKAAVERARAGFYPRELLQGYPESWLRRFFVEEVYGYRVALSLRQQFVFACQDLINDPPLPHMDLIWCHKFPTRGQKGLRREVPPKLWYALRPNGFLFFGRPGVARLGTDFFQVIDRRNGLYRRVSGARPPFCFGKPPSVLRNRRGDSEALRSLALPVRPEPVLPATTEHAGGKAPFSSTDPPQRIAQLERELADTRARLKATEEEFGASKEALQVHGEELGAANEELRSINEDLETSREDLETSQKALEATNRDLVRRNAELLALNDDLSNLHAALPMAIVLLGRDLTVRRFTPRARVHFDLHAADIGRPLRLLQHTLEFPELEQFIAEVLESANVREREVRDRQGRWYSLCVRPYVTADKTIDGVVLALVDIDALKRSQSQIEAQSAKLRETVGELEHFSYSITHDMRAPLRALRSFASLLLTEFSSALPGEGQEYLQRIARAADRMDQLITDALDYSKAVRQHLPLAPIDPETLLRGMVESYPAFQHPQAQVQLSGAFPRVLANQAGLTQCFSNLLNNAVKFVRPGQVPQVRVWAEQRPGIGQLMDKWTGGSEPSPHPSASPSIPPSDQWVRIWFEDNGIGIPPESQDRIFEMFQRLDRKYEGTGIGLALVRKVIERMGGKVGIESAPNGGSRFWLDLRPASQGKAL